MSTGSGLVPTSDAFDKKAWLEKVCSKPFDGSEFTCFCGHSFDDGSEIDANNAWQHELAAKYKEGVQETESLASLLLYQIFRSLCIICSVVCRVQL